MQLLKGLFAILVLLNIIVFANVVYQKMNGNRALNGPQVVAVPVGAGGVDANGNVQPAQAGGGKLPIPAAPMVKREPQTTPSDIPAPALPKSAPNCTAQITLPEDDYHRLKNFISNWSHSAVRNVVESKQKATASAVQYQVLVADANDSVLQQLRDAGINASPQGGSISLGLYADASRANAVRDRAIAAGVGGVIVSERGGAQLALSSAQYTVVFRNIDSQQAQKITEVLGRYGRLQRSACAQ